jgi:hypothetical protein
VCESANVRIGEGKKKKEKRKKKKKDVDSRAILIFFAPRTEKPSNRCDLIVLRGVVTSGKSSSRERSFFKKYRRAHPKIRDGLKSLYLVNHVHP